MSTTHDRTEHDASLLAHATAGSRVGRFTHYPVTGIWQWNDEVFQIHGLEPWSVTPTTDYILARTHLEDRSRVSRALVCAQDGGDGFSIVYRLVAADDVERMVVLLCEPTTRDDGGDPTAVRGYYIDLTHDFRLASDEVARVAVARSAQHRGTIEQAVGGLMVGYGLDATQAFGLLSWWSQNRNVKVRELARRVLQAASRGAVSGPDVRARFDALLHDVSANRASPTSGDA